MLHQKIYELYERTPEAKDQFRWHSRDSFQDTLKKIERSSDPWNETQHEVTRVLAFLDPKTIYDEFGLEKLFLVWVKYIIMDEKEKLRRGLSEITGISEDNLERARLAEWQIYTDDNVENITRTAYYAQSFSERTALLPPLETILARCANPGIILSEKRKSDYTIQTLVPRRNYAYGWIEEGRDLYLDTPLGFTLNYKGKQNAIAGVSVRSNKVILEQIQGVGTKYYDDGTANVQHARGLVVLDWKKLLVEYVAAWATQEKMDGLIIRSGHNNKWTKKKWDGGPRKGQPHLELEKALDAYDATAKRLGFKQQEDENWYRAIPYVQEKGIVEKAKAIFAS